MAKEKMVKVNRTRVTLVGVGVGVGDVDVDAVAKLVSSSFPGVEVKTWNKRTKTAKKPKTQESEVPAT